MSCKLCYKWLLGVKNYSDAFIKGSSNYCRLNISDKKEGQKYQKKVVNVIPIDAPIVKGLKKMSETERNKMQVLLEVSYLNAKKGQPCSDFSNWLEWAELQGVKVSVPHKNRTQCTKFIK